MKIRPATIADEHKILTAISALRNARRMLLEAGAGKAALAAHRAIKSAEGAARHVERRIAHTVES